MSAQNRKSPENFFQTLKTEVSTLDKDSANPAQVQGLQNHINVATQCMKELSSLLSANDAENKSWLEKNGAQVQTVVDKFQSCLKKLQGKNIIKDESQITAQLTAIGSVLKKYGTQAANKKF